MLRPGRVRARVARRASPSASAAAQAEAAEQRAAPAEREREAAARLAVAEERARIARELHDVVAHAMSVMVLQVGAVRHRLPDDLAEDARGAAAASSATGRSALGEMRQLLGAMRRDDEAPELAPQPGLGRLDVLLEQVRARGPAGGAARSRASPVALPEALDLSAYRIVQEGLTNALKHAHASAGRRRHPLRPRRAAHRGPRRRRAAARRCDGLGHGLVGIRERVKIYGGEMTGGAARTAAASCSRTRLPLSGGRRMTIRVLVADDQSMVRAGFRMLLGGEPDIEVVAEAGNGVEAVHQAARFRPTVMLMDIRMPELDGLEATRRILAADPAARVLMLTTFDLDEYVYEALQRRARAASCSRTTRPSSSSPRCAPSPPATRCSPRPSPSA